MSDQAKDSSKTSKSSGDSSPHSHSSGSKQTKSSVVASLSEEQREDIFEAFKLCDSKNEGIIESKQLKFAMRALGFEPRKQEIKNILDKHLDKDKRGQVAYDDFEAFMAKKILEKDANDEIMKAFSLFDKDNTGKISYSNLKAVAQELGEQISDEELREMIQEADRDHDGQVNRDEFLQIMKKTCLY